MPTRNLTIVLTLFAIATAVAMAQRSHGPGFGRRGDRGGDERHEADHEVFQYLLTNHKQIRRTVTDVEQGVITVTESDDPRVAEKIQEHVEWMQHRIENNNPIRLRDPLFAELFRHTDKISMKVETTEKGVRVTETSDDPDVVRLIQAHAKVVSGFVKRGFPEAMTNHKVPGQTESKPASFSYPKIDKYGKVVQLVSAAEQPRDESKIVVDVTKGAAPDVLNPAIEKVARYVNIYAGAGEQPASVQIVVVLHGDATFCILNDDAYGEKFGTRKNPNLDCLHELHEAGVELLVCGQSLVGKGHQPDDVVVFVDTAVSALTAIVNRQADGYAYVPLLK